MTFATEADWKLLTDLLAERFGLGFGSGRQDILEARLKPRISALHLDGVRAYYHFLSCHPAREEEFAELARRLTNNETYFFREPAQFDAIVEQVIPALAPRGNGRPLRILSAGCSSGEEPYSLAVRLVDAGLELSGLRWEIDACDLHPGKLEHARRGVYEGMSLRACEETERQHCFHVTGTAHELKERYRRRVKFFQANLAAPASGFGWGPYEIILCRNMLIYFVPDALDRVIARFAQLLVPGGFLFLGHSESLFDRSAQFEPVYFKNSMGYRRLEDR